MPLWGGCRLKRRGRILWRLCTLFFLFFVGLGTIFWLRKHISWMEFTSELDNNAPSKDSELDYVLEFDYELDIREGFNWSLDIPNFAEVVEKLGANPGNFSALTNLPINYQFSRIEFLHNVIDKEKEEGTPLGILILVKSAVNNVAKRDAIRSTWGHSDYLNREDTKLSGDLPTKVVFICGLPQTKVKNHSDPGIEKVNFKNVFPSENEWKHNDIIVADFIDIYGNNTYKTILALRWAEEEYPPGFQYLFLVDDDMYVDLVNLVKYLKEFPNRRYQVTTKSIGSGLPFYKELTSYPINTSQVVRGYQILEEGLYDGRIYFNPIPTRRITVDKRTRTWMTLKEEYPYNFYPHFAPGGGIILSRNTVHKFYYASFLTKSFKLDDVYLGIIAKKMGIIPVTNPHIFPFDAGHHPPTERDLQEGIAIHGFCTKKMLDIWRRRKLKGSVEC